MHKNVISIFPSLKRGKYTLTEEQKSGGQAIFSALKRTKKIIPSPLVGEGQGEG